MNDFTKEELQIISLDMNTYIRRTPIDTKYVCLYLSCQAIHTKYIGKNLYRKGSCKGSL